MAETVKSVERASDILLLLHRSNRKLGVSEIASELDLHKSTVHRILASFEVKGLVKKTSDEKYGIGLRIFAMGLKVSKEYSVLEIIKPYMRRLMNEVGEAVNVSMLEDHFNGNYRTIMVAKEYSAESVLLANFQNGTFSDAHISAVGKCLLAFSKKVDLSKISDAALVKYTENSITTMSDLLKQIDEVRKMGYAVDNEEREQGLFCVAVPIIDADGDASFAISISGPTVRMKNDELQSKIEALIRMQGEINQVLRTLK